MNIDAPGMPILQRRAAEACRRHAAAIRHDFRRRQRYGSAKPAPQHYAAVMRAAYVELSLMPSACCGLRQRRHATPMLMSEFSYCFR